MNIPDKIVVNGYTILYIKNTKKITSVSAYVNTGSLYEDKNESGIAHLLEHILTDSWNKCSGSCTEYWSKKGIMSNARTSSSYTSYYMLGLSNDPGDMYDYISSIITNPKINKKCYENSKKAVKDEILIRLNSSYWKIENEFYKLLDDTTHGMNHLSDYEHKLKVLDSLTIKKLINFYNKWYFPKNIFFTVVTNECKKNVINHFNKYLKIKNNNFEIPEKINIKINTKNNTLIKREDSHKTTFEIGFIYNNPCPKDFIICQLINDILVGDISSLLYIELRDKLNLIYGISLKFDFDKNYIISRFSANCQFVNSQKLLINLVDTLNKFLAGKFNDNLIKRSKDRITIKYLNNCQENTEYASSYYAEQYILSGKTTFTPSMINKEIQSFSKNDLIKLSNKLFNKDMIIVCETK